MTATERIYVTHDKAEWGPGPWQDEPDKVQWVDPATGLDCLIVRNGSGALCGYVGVPPAHPWHGVGYAECIEGGETAGCPDYVEHHYCDHEPEAIARVHGGLTYSDACQPSDDPARGICHVPEPGRPANVWWFGFDCAHSGDLCPKYDAHTRSLLGGSYKDVGYVRGEVGSLARQLAEVDR